MAPCLPGSSPSSSGSSFVASNNGRDVSRPGGGTSFPSTCSLTPRDELSFRLPWSPGCDESMGVLPSPTATSLPTPPIAALLLVYSIPAVLLLSVCCVIRWRPCSHISSPKQFFKWYFLCCSKEAIDELQAADRHNILPIDVQSLASLVSETDVEETATTSI